MPTHYYLTLSFVLFLIGTGGVLLRRNALIVLMGIELQLNAGNLTLLAFSRALGDEKGHVFAFLIIALAAAEAAVGLAILVGAVPQPPDRQPRRSLADEALTEAARIAMPFHLRLIPLLPFIGATLLLLFGRRWKRATVVLVACRLGAGGLLRRLRRLLHRACPRRPRWAASPTSSGAGSASAAGRRRSRSTWRSAWTRCRGCCA